MAGSAVAGYYSAGVYLWKLQGGFLYGEGEPAVSAGSKGLHAGKRGHRILPGCPDRARSEAFERTGITEVRPNTETDPEFAKALYEAENAGVKVLFLMCHVEHDTIEVVGANRNMFE